MDQRTLGRTGVHVSPLCLGAMMFGAWGETDHDASIRVIHRALDAGVNFIDTADVYARGESEEIVGKALAGGRRDNVVLATKFHGTMGDDANEAGNSRRWIFREVEASLKRLKTDWIDLYQVHRWDPWTDHEETLGALSDLVAQVPRQPPHGPVTLALARGLVATGLRFRVVHRSEVRQRSVGEDDVLLEDVVDRLAVEHRPRAAGIVGHHAADGRAAGRRDVGREAQAVRAQ